MTGLIPFGPRGGDLDSLFNVFGGFNTAPFTNRLPVSSYTVDEVENGVKINFDMPGVKPEDVKVEFNNGVLSVHGERHEVKESKDEKGEVTSKMVNTATYSNNFKLGDKFNVEELDAVIEHGVLSITLPLAEKAKPRSITVRGGESKDSALTSKVSEGETVKTDELSEKIESPVTEE